VAKRTKSGLKRKRQDLRRAVRNQAVQSRVKTLVKQARDGRAEEDAIRSAISALDVAARKGVIHPNAAARKKSRLVRWAAARTPATTPA
jgi:small subunit ribosomal protein S20